MKETDSDKVDIQLDEIEIDVAEQSIKGYEDDPEIKSIKVSRSAGKSEIENDKALNEEPKEDNSRLHFETEEGESIKEPSLKIAIKVLKMILVSFFLFVVGVQTILLGYLTLSDSEYCKSYENWARLQFYLGIIAIVSLTCSFIMQLENCLAATKGIIEPKDQVNIESISTFIHYILIGLYCFLGFWALLVYQTDECGYYWKIAIKSEVVSVLGCGVVFILTMIVHCGVKGAADHHKR